MDSAEPFEEVRTEMLGTGLISSGDNLLGMAIDIDAYLGQIEGIDPDSITVTRSDDPLCLIQAQCWPLPGVSDADAIEAVERRWVEDLSYRTNESHRVRLDHLGRLVVDFVTQAPGGRYRLLTVTGSIIVGR